jgi:hypothetical protein
MYAYIYMAILLVRWLPWSWFLLCGYDAVDLLHIRLR